MSILALGGVILHARHPSSIAILPPCPTNALIGIQCAGCGSTRAIHHLLNLRLGDAFQLNPALVVVGLPFAAAFIVDMATRIFARRTLAIRLSPRFGLIAAFGLVVYTIFRNL
jgi:hypothetical protein